MTKYFLPSEQDKIVLEWMYEQLKRRVLNNPILPEEVRNHNSTDCYVAKLPDDGIPALSYNGGINSGPGYADCDIYKIIEDSSSYVLIEAGFQEKVFNISDSAITGNYAKITRDKYGMWIVGAAAGEGVEAGTGTCVSSIGGVGWEDMEIVDPSLLDPDDPGHLLYVDPITGCLKLFPIFPCN